MKVLFPAPSVPFMGMDTALPRQSNALRGVPFTLAILLIAGATLASLGIAVYIGWHSSGPMIERIIRIMLIGVAVLFLHWSPVGWSALRGFARFVAVVLWAVAMAVVLYTQVAFFMLSQQHAGTLRAATIDAPVLASSASQAPGRTRTEIAQQIAKVSTALAQAQAARCSGDCRTLMVRRARLEAEYAALNVEAQEVRRRELNEDRRLAQADRVEEARQRLRADPVAFPVATWLGIGAYRLELIVALAHAVVLEGTAIIGWLLVSVVSCRAAPAFSRGSDKLGTAYESETLDAGRERDAPKVAGHASDRSATTDNSDGLGVCEDDLFLQRIHEAVIAGQLKPSQQAIRKFLRCAQPKAGRLNREYVARFGSMSRQGTPTPAPSATIPAVADG